MRAGGLKVLGVSEEGLKELAKGAAEKVALAWWLRRETTASLRWVSERPGLGHHTRASQAASRARGRPGQPLAKLMRKLSLELSEQ